MPTSGDIEMITTTHFPPLPITFSRDLLSTPIFRFDAEYLRKIGDWLLEKIDSAKFHKFPSTIVKLKKKHQQFMELYERAKIEEGKTEGKKFIKSKSPFYRPRLSDKNEQRAFEKLDYRRKTSEFDRRYSKVSTIWKVKQ